VAASSGACHVTTGPDPSNVPPLSDAHWKSSWLVGVSASVTTAWTVTRSPRSANCAGSFARVLPVGGDTAAMATGDGPVGPDPQPGAKASSTLDKVALEVRRTRLSCRRHRSRSSRTRPDAMARIL
jgi:hypothetical protein